MKCSKCGKSVSDTGKCPSCLNDKKSIQQFFNLLAVVAFVLWYFCFGGREMVFKGNIKPVMNSQPKTSLPPIQCACGCGTEFWFHDSSGRPRFYVSGHNRNSPTMDMICNVLLNGPLRVSEIVTIINKSSGSIKTCLCEMKKRRLVEYVKEDENVRED